MEEWAKKIGWIGFWDEKYLRLLVRENLKYALPLEQRYSRVEEPNRIRREVGLPPV